MKSLLEWCVRASDPSSAGIGAKRFYVQADDEQAAKDLARAIFPSEIPRGAILVAAKCEEVEYDPPFELTVVRELRPVLTVQVSADELDALTGEGYRPVIMWLHETGTRARHVCTKDEAMKNIEAWKKNR